jgi:hypothetical protein
MDSDELKRCLKLIVKNVNIRFDVIPSNKLDSYLKFKSKIVLVVNTDPEWKPGVHWVVVCKLGKETEFMDSYGESITKYGLYFKNLARQFPIENCVQYQSLKSSVCGMYCLYFIHSRLNGNSFADIMNKFTCNLRLNDRRVSEWYVSMFKNIQLCMKCNTKNQCCTSKISQMNNKVYLT